MCVYVCVRVHGFVCVCACACVCVLSAAITVILSESEDDKLHEVKGTYLTQTARFDQNN